MRRTATRCRAPGVMSLGAPVSTRPAPRNRFVPRATSLHPPQRSQPVDVPRQDQDVGLGNRAIGSRRRRRARLSGLPQPEQSHPVALLKSHGAHRLADGAGGRMRGNDQVPAAQLQIVDGPRVMDQQRRFAGAALLRVDDLGGPPRRAGCPSPGTRPARRDDQQRQPVLRLAGLARRGRAGAASHRSPGAGAPAACGAGRLTRLGGCWWPPQPRGCIPDGAVAKYRCRVGREVAHPGPSPDPDEEMSTIRLFR
jgi:hypothetical protein